MTFMKSATTASALVQKNLFKLVWKLTGMAILTPTQPGCYLYVQHIPGTYITCVHVTGTFYKGHLATKLFVHIRQMLWKFRIFPGSFTQTPGLFFSGFSAHLEVIAKVKLWFFLGGEHCWEAWASFEANEEGEDVWRCWKWQVSRQRDAHIDGGEGASKKALGEGKEERTKEQGDTSSFGASWKQGGAGKHIWLDKIHSTAKGSKERSKATVRNQPKPWIIPRGHHHHPLRDEST